ncbi:MAG TPA: HEAT repeat domain-containing protein, partial [Thermoguttaceae bacterium]|nr:HEAT repeat domain-containing protein [Thermoguttaceae bacterium]
LLAELCEKRPSRYVIFALERSGDREAWPALRQVINRRLITPHDLHLAGMAAEALARAGDGEIVPMLRRWLATDNTDKLRMAIHAAGLLGDNRLVPDLLKVDANVFGRDDRNRLYRALVSCGDVRYLDKVHQAALDERQYVYESQRESPPDYCPIYNYSQNWALDAIAKLASPRSLPVLDQLSANASDPIIRQRAAAIAKTIRQ